MPSLNLGDVYAIHGNGAVWRSGLPTQPSALMVAERRSGRGEDEVRRQLGERPGHRFRDRGETLRCCVQRFVGTAPSA